MNQETTKLGRTIMAAIAVLVGLFLMFLSPFIVMDALNPALHRLVEVFQVQDPSGVWDTPVAILTATFHTWLALFVFAGAALLLIAKDLYAGKSWARPAGLALMAIPSIGGMTMVIPWLVLVMTDAQGNSNPTAGIPAAMPIMLIGLLGYFVIMLLEKSDWKTKLAQVVVFTALGIVGGMVFMNAQHGVRHFNNNPSAPFFDEGFSNPELFLGGYVMYAAVALFIVAIYLLGARKEGGWYAGMIVGLVTFAAAFLTFLDRQAVGAPSAQEWMRGALLSLGLIAILAIPFFKNRVLGLKA
jgi:hypothetical protein